MDAQELIKNELIVKMYAGSHAYGTSLPSSDVDFRGIFCARPINIRTPFFPIEEATDTSEEDTKYYELRQFMKLCVECNPNIVELLWTDSTDIVYRTTAFEHLRLARQELLSSKIAFTTSGYALAQLKRIKGHNKWINNPQPEQAPRPAEFVSLVQWFGKEKMMPRDFDLVKHFNHLFRLVPYSEVLFGLYFTDDRYDYTVTDTGDLITTFDGERSELGQPLAVIKWNREEYRAAKERHEQYWTWKKNRNQQRSVLEEQFGYDTKHAMHLVRLLRMGLEALRDCELVVRRPDAEELLAIRAGAWTYEQIVEYAETMDKEIREVWYPKTKLPKRPNLHRAAQLLMDVQDIMWSKG